MVDIERAALFGKMNSLCYKSMESATTLCKLRGNPYVELAHWVQQVLQLQDSDLHRILRVFEVDPARLSADVTSSLDRLPRGATSISDFSAHIELALERAWTYATLRYGESLIRSGHLMVALTATRELSHVVRGISEQFAKIRPDDLAERLQTIASESPEQNFSRTLGGDEPITSGGTPGPTTEAMPPAEMQRGDVLARFTHDLTQAARESEIDPIVGRDTEIRQIVDILMRRRQNNPILTGEAGVGKTAVVEGLALRIARGDVPPPFRSVSLLALDVGLLQAGASMKGEFENRLRQVIDEVQASTCPVVLFIDEAHTLVGAGGAAGTGDAANLLKPALARGTLRTIAATTWSEYKKYIEKDAALTRRFQVVQVAEPSDEHAVLMMRGVASRMEAHHRVQILDEAIESAVHLSHRYITARQLPDKAVSLLDTAAARVAVSQHTVPAKIDDARKRIDALRTELEIIGRERSIGIEVHERERRASDTLAAEEDRLSRLEKRWVEEKQLVEDILELRAALLRGGREVEGTDDEARGSAVDVPPNESDGNSESWDLSNDIADGGTSPERVPLSEDERGEALERLQSTQGRLEDLQGESPLILPAVTADAVASVVADWTGIPVGRMVRNEVEAVLRLADTLHHRVVGQRHALDTIARRISTSRASLDHPGKPIGVFLLAGPSGVGKTETALALAEAIYGGEQNVITINMSEYQEAHTVSTLKGAPPGYVGYGEGGVLTEAVRRKPYSVILLDEVEKAHSDVHEIFFQVFDKGQMEDGEGRMIDFRNTIILLTTNVGDDLIATMCKDSELMPDHEGLATAIRGPLLRKFPAALLGRLVAIPYYPLGDEILNEIARLQLERVRVRVEENHGAVLEYDDAVLDLIRTRCNEVESGGRMIDSILTNTVLPEISRRLLEMMLDGALVRQIRIGVDDGEFTYFLQ